VVQTPAQLLSIDINIDTPATLEALAG